MAYDEKLAARVRAAFGSRKDVEEVKMFGGVTYMVRGHMACGVMKDALMIRVDAARHDELAGKPHAHAMEFTRRPMPGFILVDLPGIASERALNEWIALGTAQAESKPPKARKRTASKLAVKKAATKKTTATKKATTKTKSTGASAAKKRIARKRSS